MKLDLDALHGPALADAGLALPLFDVGEMRSQAHDLSLIHISEPTRPY